jgi:hypothetical protein
MGAKLRFVICYLRIMSEMVFAYEFSFIIVIERRWKLTRENAFLETPKGT